MTCAASQILIRPAVDSEAPQLTALVMTSKAYWGYSVDFLERAAAGRRLRAGHRRWEGVGRRV